MHAVIQWSSGLPMEERDFDDADDVLRYVADNQPVIIWVNEDGSLRLEVYDDYRE